MLELQRKLLGDTVRNAAFHAALKKTITPKKSIVLDVGSGTGFLSFLAEKLGAKQCVLIESGEVGMLAEEIATQNNMKKCTFIHGHSSDLPLPKGDIVVSETLGNYALEEGIIDTLNDARDYLKKGGQVIPCALKQFVCPVISSRLQKQIDVWDVGYGVNMDAARTISLQNMYVKTLSKKDLLHGGKQAKAWDSIDFTKQNDNVREATIEWKLPTKTTVHGLALWWNATLVPGVSLSTSPLTAPTHWEQIYLPLLQPVVASASDTLKVGLHSDTNPDVRIRLQWTVEHIDKKGIVRSTQSSDTQVGLL